MNSPYTNKGKLQQLNNNLEAITRTYPYLAAGIALTAHNTALTMGTIIEIVPVATNEINTLTISHACDLAGNITIDLNGCKFTKAVTAGNTGEVAEQLRSYDYISEEGEEWAVTGSGNDVIFTRLGISTTGVLSNLGTTGVTGSFVKTNTGVGIGNNFHIQALQVGLIGNADTYILTLYRGNAGYEEAICSRRFTKAAASVEGGEVATKTPLIEAGTRISASLASVNGGASKTSVVSLAYTLESSIE